MIKHEYVYILLECITSKYSDNSYSESIKGVFLKRKDAEQHKKDNQYNYIDNKMLTIRYIIEKYKIL